MNARRSDAAEFHRLLVALAEALRYDLRVEWAGSPVADRRARRRAVRRAARIVSRYADRLGRRIDRGRRAYPEAAREWKALDAHETPVARRVLSPDLIARLARTLENGE